MVLTRRTFARLHGPALGALLLLFSAGCRREQYPQTTMLPESDYARMIQKILDLQVFWVVVIFAVVQILLLIAVIRFRARPGAPDPKPVHGNTFLEIAWTIAPAFILALVAVPTVTTIYKTQAEIPANALTITVVGHQWWWEFKYPAYGFTTASEMHIPAAKPVVVEIETADVVHSFWIPAMGGKRDAIPNHTTRFYFTPDRPGEFMGQCAELCGVSHANMHMRLFVQTQADFDAWVANQQAPAMMPDSMSLAATGRKLFSQSACIACHTIQGVAAGVVGPNLTHLASRTMIAGEMYPNDDAHLRHWINNAPGDKPGSLMMALGLPQDQIAAIAAYLQTLK